MRIKIRRSAKGNPLEQCPTDTIVWQCDLGDNLLPDRVLSAILEDIREKNGQVGIPLTEFERIIRLIITHESDLAILGDEDGQTGFVAPYDWLWQSLFDELARLYGDCRDLYAMIM